jgi:hypothetical protein
MTNFLLMKIARYLSRTTPFVIRASENGVHVASVCGHYIIVIHEVTQAEHTERRNRIAQY